MLNIPCMEGPASCPRREAVHDICPLAIERMKAALTVFLFVPAIIHDQVEQAAKSWKEKNRREEDLDRLKALLNAVNGAWLDTITHLP